MDGGLQSIWLMPYGVLILTRCLMHGSAVHGRRHCVSRGIEVCGCKRLARLWTTLVAVAALGCRTTRTAIPSPTATVALPKAPPATSTSTVTATQAPVALATATKPPPPRPERVLVLSLDGARDDWVDVDLQDGVMANLAELARRGVRADYARTIDPSLTATAHVSIATGAYPARTGQVSNKFHLSKNAFYWYTSGFDEPEMQVAPLWRMAMSQDLTTATLFWPAVTLQHADRLADYTVAYGTREAYSRLHTVTPNEAQGWESPPVSFSSLLEAELPILGSEDARVTQVFLLAADSTDDGVADYDSFRLCTGRRATATCAEMRVGGWAALMVRPRLHGGAYFKLLSAASEQLQVFQSALWYNEARPAELLRDVNERFGFFPPAPDYYALEQGWISAQDYWHMAEVQTLWMADVEAYVLQAYRPNLTFAWLGASDECGHQFLLVDERQAGYSAEKSKEYTHFVRAAYGLVDEGLGILLKGMNLDQDAVFVVSDHGMAPIHSDVFVNTILEQAGLLYYGEGASYPIDTARSKAVAFASGGAVNIYINLKGREQPGIVTSEEYGIVEQEIVQALQEAKSESGEPLFARVLRRDELSTLHLDSPNSGDVFAQAALGYTLSDWRGNPDVVEPSAYYGQHGYDSGLLEMRAIFIAAGQGIPSGLTVPAVCLLDVAPTVATLLGLSPSESMQGTVLRQALRDIGS